MKTKWIIPAALLLALTLTTSANAGPRHKVEHVGGSHFGFFFGSPGFGFNYGQHYGRGHRHFRGYNKPWRHHRRHWRRGGWRGGWRGYGYGPRSYRPRYNYSEHHHYYNDRRPYNAPVQQQYDRGAGSRGYRPDPPAMHMHLYND